MVCGCDLLFQGFKSTSIIYSLTSCENCELHTPFPSLRVFPKELTHIGSGALRYGEGKRGARRAVGAWEMGVWKGELGVGSWEMGVIIEK